MRGMFIDARRGLAGDMMLAAMAHLGVDLTVLESALREAGLPVKLKVIEERRGGLFGRKLDVRVQKKQELRKLTDILRLLDKLPLSLDVLVRAQQAFVRLAEAEAAAHGVPVSKVHFHELGAVDTVVDVVGALYGLEALGVGLVLCSALPWFEGSVQSEHGELPLPAPATIRLYEGKPVFPAEAKEELVTPTGALLADQLAKEFTGGPEGRILGTGVGFGARPEGQGLRLVLFDPGEASLSEEIFVLETNLDHLTAEETGRAMEAVMEAGALDALYLPGLMKKGRPGGLLQVLCRPAELDAVRAAVFAHTLTLGLRETHGSRRVLPRGSAEIPSPFGPVAAKSFSLQGRKLLRPEHESLAEISRKTGLSVPEIRLTLCAGQKEEDGEVLEN